MRLLSGKFTPFLGGNVNIRRLLTAGGLAAVLVASLAPPASGAPAGEDGTPITVGAPAPAARTVTLITGDRVTMIDSDRVVIHRGPDRAGITYLTRRVNDELYVVPSDAVPLLRDDVLDQRLFNVSLLMAYGYHDQRSDLPLITTGGGVAVPAMRANRTTAVEVVRELPAIDGVAIEVAKSALGSSGRNWSISPRVSPRFTGRRCGWTDSASHCWRRACPRWGHRPRGRPDGTAPE